MIFNPANMFWASTESKNNANIFFFVKRQQIDREFDNKVDTAKERESKSMEQEEIFKLWPWRRDS